ncbi:MAG: helix-hairpin-helix domain-containing protein [Eubacteriales bacterium]
MAGIIIPKSLTIEDKISLMQEDSKFEVANDADAEATALRCADGVRSKGNPPKVPKIYFAGKCIFNCAYCGCRGSREEKVCYCHTPRELAELSVKMAKDNGHGVFISSAIHQNADYTQENIAEAVRIMRQELFYSGYIHAKVMPGADPLLIAKTGKYASRMSVNIEVAKSEGYDRIAKQKSKSLILTPMQDISDQIKQAKDEKRRFAVSQTTQLMAGSIGEDDRTIMTLSQALYKKYGLKRVYYTAFTYRHEAKGYPGLPFTQTPYWRMARLYQADRLLQLYGFTYEDVTPECYPFLEQDIDPKAAWALRHLSMYPVEVNKADYETLIRVPGIGITYARKIIEARRHCTLTHDILKKMKVSLKRSNFFITCAGKYMGGDVLDSPNVRDCLVTGEDRVSIAESLAEECLPS